MKKMVMTVVFVWVCSFGWTQHPIVQNLLNGIHLDSLIASVNRLSGQVPVMIDGYQYLISSRQHQTTGNQLAFRFLKSELARHGYYIDSLQFGMTGKNLYAIKYGSLYSNYWWMLGAHYDDLPLSAIAPGADDNASGCAAVLEAARLFSAIDFPYTIVLALWDEEEPGLFGSSAHVEQIGWHQETLLGYINLDMIAWDSNEDSVADLHTRPIKHAQIMVDKATFCNTAYHIGLTLNVVNPGNYNSDQKPFWNKNYAAIAINEHYLHDLNPYMHTSNDRIEHFNMDYFLKMTQIALSTFAELALDTTIDYRTEHLDDIALFPNPFQKQITLNIPTKGEHIVRIAIINHTGTIISDTMISDNYIVQPTTTIDLNFLRSGLYFLRLTTNKNSYTKRIVKLDN